MFHGMVAYLWNALVSHCGQITWIIMLIIDCMLTNVSAHGTKYVCSVWGVEVGMGAVCERLANLNASSTHAFIYTMPWASLMAMKTRRLYYVHRSRLSRWTLTPWGAPSSTKRTEQSQCVSACWKWYSGQWCWQCYCSACCFGIILLGCAYNVACQCAWANNTSTMFLTDRVYSCLKHYICQPPVTCK